MLECRPTRYDYMKHYLIDSENVGDFWIPLLELPAEQAELVVFYTKNSPHMSYDSLIKLKESDRTVTFIKCYEGTNALDFQLCSELGFLIANNPGDEFIIVTNDTGYDAAVKYWRRKEYSVKRIAGKDSRTGGRRRGTPARFDVAAEVSSILHKLVRMPDSDENEAQEEQERTDAPETAHDLAYSEPEEGYEEEPGEEENSSGNDEFEEENTADADETGEDEAGESSEDDFLEDEPSEDELSEDVPSEDVPSEDSDDHPEEEPEEDHAGSEDFSAEYSAEEKSATGSFAQEDDPAQAAGSEDADALQAQLPSENPAGDTEESVLKDQENNEDEGNPQEGGKESTQQDDAQPFIPDPEEITAIVNCIGMENLAELHNQLIQFYAEDGKEIYQALKSGSLTIDKIDWDREEKFLYYCALIFRHSDEPTETITEENISEFASFLLGAENKRKNLNSLRYALLKHYGKEKGRRYYFMLKPYVKALNQM